MTANVQHRAGGQKLDDLAQIIGAYNQVTQKLQHSHEALRAEVARLQQELVSTDAQLQRSKRLAALGEMAAGIAHEIRNPLAAIALYANILVDELRGSSMGTAGDYAGKIAAAVGGLDAIVNDVLSLAREIEPKPIDLCVREVFNKAVEAHRPGIDAHRIGVRRPGGEDDVTVYADPDLIHQAILNLIRNAVDAMSPHGGTLSLTAGTDGQQTVLTVADTGPGISEPDVDRIFNPFFTTRNTGTGLGLAIVHRNIDAHGGAISVANDGGAVFTLSLPMARSAPRRTQSRELVGVTV